MRLERKETKEERRITPNIFSILSNPLALDRRRNIRKRDKESRIRSSMRKPAVSPLILIRLIFGIKRRGIAENASKNASLVSGRDSLTGLLKDLVDEALKCFSIFCQIAQIPSFSDFSAGKRNEMASEFLFGTRLISIDI